jgi:hypothetical protein
MPDIDLSGPTFVSARRSSNFRGRVADDQTKRMVMRFPVAFALEGMLSNQNIILLKKAAPIVGHCAAPRSRKLIFPRQSVQPMTIERQNCGRLHAHNS